MNALLIGILLIVLFLAINAAVWAAAPFIAVAVIIGLIWLSLSKGSKKSPNDSDNS